MLLKLSREAIKIQAAVVPQVQVNPQVRVHQALAQNLHHQVEVLQALALRYQAEVLQGYLLMNWSFSVVKVPH